MSEYYGVASTPTEDFLAHYGVKGMKWGVRKKPEKKPKDSSRSKQMAIKLLDKHASMPNKTTKDKKKKEAYEEKVLERMCKSLFEDLDDPVGLELADEISRRIVKKSGNIYTGESKTEANRKAFKKMNDIEMQGWKSFKLDPFSKELEAYTERYEKAFDDYRGVCLKDIGFEDNKKNRAYIANIVCWD